jgi:hypothetical protein
MVYHNKKPMNSNRLNKFGNMSPKLYTLEYNKQLKIEKHNYIPVFKNTSVEYNQEFDYFIISLFLGQVLSYILCKLIIELYINNLLT